MIRIVHGPKPALPLRFLTKVQQISFCDNAPVIMLHSHHINKKSNYAQSTHIQTQTGNKTSLTAPLIHTRAKKKLAYAVSKKKPTWKSSENQETRQLPSSNTRESKIQRYVHDLADVFINRTECQLSRIRTWVFQLWLLDTSVTLKLVKFTESGKVKVTTNLQRLVFITFMVSGKIVYILLSFGTPPAPTLIVT